MTPLKTTSCIPDVEVDIVDVGCDVVVVVVVVVVLGVKTEMMILHFSLRAGFDYLASYFLS